MNELEEDEFDDDIRVFVLFAYLTRMVTVDIICSV